MSSVPVALLLSDRARRPRLLPGRVVVLCLVAAALLLGSTTASASAAGYRVTGQSLQITYPAELAARYAANHVQLVAAGGAKWLPGGVLSLPVSGGSLASDLSGTITHRGSLTWKKTGQATQYGLTNLVTYTRGAHAIACGFTNCPQPAGPYAAISGAPLSGQITINGINTGLRTILAGFHVDGRTISGAGGVTTIGGFATLGSAYGDTFDPVTSIVSAFTVFPYSTFLDYATGVSNSVTTIDSSADLDFTYKITAVAK